MMHYRAGCESSLVRLAPILPGRRRTVVVLSTVLGPELCLQNRLLLLVMLLLLLLLLLELDLLLAQLLFPDLLARGGWGVAPLVVGADGSVAPGRETVAGIPRIARVAWVASGRWCGRRVPRDVRTRSLRRRGLRGPRIRGILGLQRRLHPMGRVDVPYVAEGHRIVAARRRRRVDPRRLLRSGAAGRWGFRRLCVLCGPGRLRGWLRGLGLL